MLLIWMGLMVLILMMSALTFMTMINTDRDTHDDTGDDTDDDTDDDTNANTGDDTDDGERGNLYPIKAQGSRTLSGHD